MSVLNASVDGFGIYCGRYPDHETPKLSTDAFKTEKSKPHREKNRFDVVGFKKTFPDSLIEFCIVFKPHRRWMWAHSSSLHPPPHPSQPYLPDSS